MAPKSNKPKANPDSKFWCDLHGDYEHRAYNCVALRKEIQFFIKRRYLYEFMSNNKSAIVRRDRTPPRQPPLPPHNKIINFIAGYSEVCGEPYFLSKRVAREINV